MLGVFVNMQMSVYTMCVSISNNIFTTTATTVCIHLFACLSICTFISDSFYVALLVCVHLPTQYVYSKLCIYTFLRVFVSLCPCIDRICMYIYVFLLITYTYYYYYVNIYLCVYVYVYF